MQPASGTQTRTNGFFSALIRRPTTITILAFFSIFTMQQISGIFGVDGGAFTLGLPLDHQPWTIIVAVYAHLTLSHLIANVIGVILFAPLVAATTSAYRFHLFFIGSGATAGIAQVVLMAPFGTAEVLGASGAVFALIGYVLSANPIADATFSKLPFWVRIGIIVVFAIGLTLLTASPGVALIAHAVGFIIGGLTGRIRLLAQ